MNKAVGTVCRECIQIHYWHHMEDRKRFFKVMIGDLKNGVTIPKKFVSNIREQISEQVTLESPDGKTYTVQVAKEQQNELFLRSGWVEFASAYELKQGDLLVFKSSGSSHFTVRIFDPSCCEKEISCVLLDRVPCMQERKVSHGKQMQSPTGKRLAVGSPGNSSRKAPNMDPTDSPSEEKRHVSPTKRHGDGVAKPPYILPRYTVLTDEQRSKVEAKVGAIRLETPVYVAVMKNTNINHEMCTCSLGIGAKYAREYLPCENQLSMTMRLRRKDDSWEPVFKAKYGRQQITGKGWKKFVTDNKLKPGDICLFNLRKNTTTLTMDVNIIRKTSL